MVDVVQLVRASDCGSECRGFESHPPPSKKDKRKLSNKGFRLLFYHKAKIPLSAYLTLKLLLMLILVLADSNNCR